MRDGFVGAVNRIRQTRHIELFEAFPNQVTWAMCAAQYSADDR